MISVDDFLKEQGIEHLDVLKIDAEGNDMQVRRGWLGSCRIVTGL